MTALCRSSLVDCMVRALCWPWTCRLYVYISACVLECEVLIGYWCLMKYEVVNLRPCAMLVSEYTTIVVCVCVRARDEYTTIVLRVCVCLLCLNMEVLINCWCLMKCEVARRKLIYIVVSINTLQWRWRLYLRWIYHGTGIALALDKQEVRLHYCRVRVHLPSMMLLMLFDASHYEVVIVSPSYTVAPIHYYNGGDVSACVGLCSLNVWNGCRVGLGSWRN